MDLRNEERMRIYSPVLTVLEQGIVQQNVVYEGQALRQTEQEYQEQLQVNNAYYEHLNNMPELDQKEIQEAQVKVIETEAEGENMMEEDTTNLQYQDLDLVLKGELERLSMAMENQLVKLSILEQAHRDIVGENSQIKEHINELKASDKQLRELVQQSVREIGNICQTYNHHGKIIEQLKDFVGVIGKVKDIIQLRTNEYNELAKKLEKDVQNWNSTTETKISDLRNKIEAKKRSIAAMDNDDDMTNKKIAEIREKRATLEDRYKEALCILEERKKFVKELQAKNAEIIDKTELLKVEFTQLEDFTEHLIAAKEKKIAAEENKQLLLNKLETCRKEYDAKMEEKSNLLTQKYELDKSKMDRDFKLQSIRALDESIEIQRRKVDELDQKIAALENDDALEKMEKEKAYLEASRNYLEQKYKKAETEEESLSNKVENLRKDNTGIKEKLAAKQAQLSKIQVTIESRKSDDQHMGRSNSGILKQTQRPKSPVSPKKVTFTGVPSSDSSGDANASQTTQGTVFDQMLAEFKFSRPQ